VEPEPRADLLAGERPVAQLVEEVQLCGGEEHL
jgi:hypothetical protein